MTPGETTAASETASAAAATTTAATTAVESSQLTRTLIALIVGQICLHSCMAGVRMAAPLEALGQGHSAWAVGVLMGLFAAMPIALAMQAGRLADRCGYHRPMRIAVGASLLGGVLAVGSTWLAGAAAFSVLCLAAMATGAGANFGLIAIQRTAGRSARNTTELKRIFSWLGLAPALSNVVGPVLAGGLIDHGGFRIAYACLMLLPLLTLAWSRRVPIELPAPRPAGDRPRGSWDLLRAPGLKRLLLVNWLLSSSWDVHAFVVPILGHERAFSASAIGLVLGVFAAAVALVRLAIPVLAHRLRESQVLVGAMLLAGLVFSVYPFMHTPWTMGCCAVLLGLALGSVQPMIMSTLHQITPADRHGEAIALRSMTINSSSAVMPLLFGLAGSAFGAAALFWVMGVAVGVGSFQARKIGLAPPPEAVLRT